MMTFKTKKHFAAIFLLMTILISACSEMSNENISTANQSSLRDLINLEVYKDPACGCCGNWVAYMEDNGFTAQTHDTSNLSEIKSKYGIAPQYRSCHTAVSSEGFVFEGHIPAKFIHQFLSERPDDAIGLAVPAMPVGSPGMEVENKFMPYQVLLIKANGDAEVYADIGTKEEQL